MTSGRPIKVFGPLCLSNWTSFPWKQGPQAKPSAQIVSPGTHNALDCFHTALSCQKDSHDFRANVCVPYGESTGLLDLMTAFGVLFYRIFPSDERCFPAFTQCYGVQPEQCKHVVFINLRFRHGRIANNMLPSLDVSYRHQTSE